MLSASEAMLDLQRGHDGKSSHEGEQVTTNGSESANPILQSLMHGGTNLPNLRFMFPDHGELTEEQKAQALAHLSQNFNRDLNKEASPREESGGDESVEQAKHAIGSDEWHKQRKDNHKAVEKRRRETINAGINDLARIVPGCEKNKSQILVRAVNYIKQLKDNETQTMERMALEKLLTDQAINELGRQVETLRNENEQLKEQIKALREGREAPVKEDGQSRTRKRSRDETDHKEAEKHAKS